MATRSPDRNGVGCLLFIYQMHTFAQLANTGGAGLSCAYHRVDPLTTNSFNPTAEIDQMELYPGVTAHGLSLRHELAKGDVVLSVPLRSVFLAGPLFWEPGGLKNREVPSRSARLSYAHQR